MTLDKVDEMNSLVAGANFLLMVGFLKYKDMLIWLVFFLQVTKYKCICTYSCFLRAISFLKSIWSKWFVLRINSLFYELSIWCFSHVYLSLHCKILDFFDLYHHVWPSLLTSLPWVLGPNGRISSGEWRTYKLSCILFELAASKIGSLGFWFWY